jgi:hypothetical protein
MTRPAPIRQPELERAIKVARKHGMCATMKPDGSILFHPAEPDTAPPSSLTSDPKPRDAREKFRNG